MVAASAKGYLSPNAYQLRNHICVIPCGGLAENDSIWTPEHLRPYAKYIVNGQAIDNLFGGFIFNGICMRANHYICPLFVGFGSPSDLHDWQLWIDSLFSPDGNLHALNSVLGNEKRDVWISIPYPHPFQSCFGHAEGRNLDFNVEDDRFTAVKWWLDRFLHRWSMESKLHSKLDLRGFLWQREAIDELDEALVKRVNAEIHSRKLLSMWLPNYGSYGVLEWKKLGFHVVALNSNYYGNTNYDHNWIKNTTMFAKYYQTGMQIVWGKGLIYNNTHLLDYLNFGLAEKCGYMTESLLVYQFPNQRLGTLQQTNIVDYIRLYTFVKGLYKRIDYRGIPY